jgi:hypothetical protein
MNVRALLQDLVKLKLPVTAAALATTIVGLIAPFGVDLSTQTVRITAALTVVGLIADQVTRYRAK